MFGNGACLQDIEALAMTATGQEAEHGIYCVAMIMRLGQFTFRVYVKKKISFA